MSLFGFGHYSTDSLADDDESPKEHSLHLSEDTTIQFSMSIATNLCDVRFIFHPFRRVCNLVYHEYTLHCSTSPGKVIDEVGKSAIVRVAQGIYDKYFLATAGYKVVLLNTELQISCRRINSQVGSAKRLHCEISNDRLKITALDADSCTLRSQQTLQPPKTGRSFAPRNVDDGCALKSVIITAKPKDLQHAAKHQKVDEEESVARSLKQVQDSYTRAMQDNKITSSLVPQIVNLSDEVWSPYLIKKQHLSTAILDERKLEVILKSLDKVLENVPIATEWADRTSNLTPKEIIKTLEITFQYPNQRSYPTTHGLPSILQLSLRFCIHADDLEADKLRSQRAASLARLIGFSLMRIYEVKYSVKSSKVSDLMRKSFKGNKDQQKQYRNWACTWCWIMDKLPGWRQRELALYLILVGKNEKALRELLRPSIPVAAGELAILLGKEVYAEGDDLEQVWVPGLIEILIAMLPDVEPDIICNSLGNTSYMNYFHTNQKTKVMALREKLSESPIIQTSPDPGCVSETDKQQDTVKNDNNDGSKANDAARLQNPNGEASSNSIVHLETDYGFDGEEFENSEFFRPLLNFTDGAFDSDIAFDM